MSPRQRIQHGQLPGPMMAGRRGEGGRLQSGSTNAAVSKMERCDLRDVLLEM